MVRELHVMRGPDGWVVSAGPDYAGPFAGALDAAACALVIARRSAPADVVLHVRVPAARAEEPSPPARPSGPPRAPPHQVQAIYVLACDRHGWVDEEVAAACRERWSVPIEALGACQADAWIDELRLLPRGGIR